MLRDMYRLLGQLDRLVEEMKFQVIYLLLVVEVRLLGAAWAETLRNVLCVAWVLVDYLFVKRLRIGVGRRW